MIETGQGQVYESQIETLFHEFFESRGIDLGHETIKQTKFTAAWAYVYNILFKPDKNTVRRNNRNSKLDYSDIDTLNGIADIFINICLEYNCMPSQYNFYKLTGISTDTLNTWDKGEYRNNIYYDLEGNVIDDISEYKLNNRGEYRVEATTAHSAFVKKLKAAYKEFYRQNLSDTPVGQITIANNDEGVGLLYAQKEAQAKAEAWGIPQQSREEIAARYQAYKELPQKPDFDS